MIAFDTAEKRTGIGFFQDLCDFLEEIVTGLHPVIEIDVTEIGDIVIENHRRILRVVLLYNLRKKRQKLDSADGVFSFGNGFFFFALVRRNVVDNTKKKFFSSSFFDCMILETERVVISFSAQKAAIESDLSVVFKMRCFKMGSKKRNIFWGYLS